MNLADAAARRDANRVGQRTTCLRTSARPMMQPASPAAASRATSSAVVTPPDAITGTSTAACISAIAATLGPLIMPSVAMSV